MCEGECWFVRVLSMRVSLKEGGKVEGERAERVCAEEERVVVSSVFIYRM